MTSPDHPSASDRLAEVMAHVNSTFTSICKVTNPNTVKVVLATNGCRHPSYGLKTLNPFPGLYVKLDDLPKK